MIFTKWLYNKRSQIYTINFFGMRRQVFFKDLFIPLWLCVLITSGVHAQQAPERVEPPFWWSGMYHDEVQVMFYGKDIGLTRVEVSYPGLEVKEVVAVESPNYLFVYFDISAAAAGEVIVNFRSGRRLAYTYTFVLKEREQGSRYREGFDASDAIYLLMPDRFANGDPENDDIPGMLETANRSNPDGRHGGDIQGIVNNLDHIAGMGFTALWINPVLENNQPRYSYHGYAATDFYQVDARFGTNEDYKNMVKWANEKGIKVIKDMIFNHCGHHHWWMSDLPTPDWLNRWDEFTRTTYRMTTILDPHASEADYKHMADGWFDTNMPDLNQRNRLMAKYLIQNSVWWIEFAGLSGIRMDTQPYADRFFMADWGAYVMAEYPQFNIVGESWIGIPAILSYFQGGKHNHDGYDSHIPSVFDFSLYDAVGMAFKEGHGWDSGMMRLYNSLTQDFLYADPYNLVVFGDNHDTDRLFTRVGGHIDKLKLALTFLFTTRGIAQMYTGTELLKSAYEHDGHGPMRSDFPGGWPGDTVNAFTKEGRTTEQNQVVAHISRLLNYRKHTAALHDGKLMHFVPQNNVYVYARYNDQQTIMVVLNNNDQEQVIDMKRYKEVWAGYRGARDLLSGQTMEGFDSFAIPGNASMVFELF
jgi:neopullulanase